MRGDPTGFGFLQPSLGSYCICLAKVLMIKKSVKIKKD
jgi:hypothetical protein